MISRSFNKKKVETLFSLDESIVIEYALYLMNQKKI